MVDNRSAGVFGVGGAFNFKSGDISGTAANTQDDKMDGNEYFGQGQQEEEQQSQNAPFVDRSAQLRATLNSLAMMNVANVLNERKRIEISNDEKKSKNKKEDREDLDEEFVNDLQEDSEEEENEYY